MKINIKPALFGLGAFLAAWQATNFDADYRSVLGAVTCAILAYSNPVKKK